MQFIRICESLGMKDCIKEFRFHSKRRFRTDYYFPSVKLAIELEGGIWVKGAHVRASGYKKDMIKYNLLSEAGIFLLRYEPKHIDYDQIRRVYGRLSFTYF